MKHKGELFSSCVRPLTNCPGMLLQAIAQRRTAMQEGVASIDESPLNSKWSVTDDWGV